MCWLGKLFGSNTTIERPSPDIRILPEQVHIVDGELRVTGYDGCFIAAIAPTNSMEPGIDDGMFVVIDPRPKFFDLIVGDILYFERPTFGAIHRIIRIGFDNEGWFAETKGDNNAVKDPFRVRPEHIRGVWRCTID